MNMRKIQDNISSLSSSGSVTETTPRDAPFLLAVHASAGNTALLASRPSFPPIRTFYQASTRRYEVPPDIELPSRLDFHQQCQSAPEIADELEAIQLGPTEVLRSNPGMLRECVHLEQCVHLLELSICNQRLRQLVSLPASLRVLILAGNELRSIPEIHRLVALQHLDLSHNQLYGPVVGTATFPLSLEHLDLSNNPQLTDIDLRMPATRLRYLDVRGNTHVQLQFWHRKPQECLYEEACVVTVEKLATGDNTDPRGDPRAHRPDWERHERHWRRKRPEGSVRLVDQLQASRDAMDRWFQIVIELAELQQTVSDAAPNSIRPDRRKHLIALLRDGRCGYQTCYPTEATKLADEWTRIQLYTRFLRLCYQRELYYNWSEVFESMYRGRRPRLVDMARWKFVHAPDEVVETLHLQDVFPRTTTEPYFAEALEQPEVMDEMFGLWRHLYVHEDTNHGPAVPTPEEHQQWTSWQIAQRTTVPGSPEHHHTVVGMVDWLEHTWWPRIFAAAAREETFPCDFAPAPTNVQPPSTPPRTEVAPPPQRTAPPAKRLEKRAKKRSAAAKRLEKRAKKRSAAAKRLDKRAKKRSAAAKRTLRPHSDQHPKTRHHRALRRRRPAR